MQVATRQIHDYKNNGNDDKIDIDDNDNDGNHDDDDNDDSVNVDSGHFNQLHWERSQSGSTHHIPKSTSLTETKTKTDKTHIDKVMHKEKTCIKANTDTNVCTHIHLQNTWKQRDSMHRVCCAFDNVYIKPEKFQLTKAPSSPPPQLSVLSQPGPLHQCRE